MKENLWESETKEEYPEPKTHKYKYVPIDEAHDPIDNSWEKYGESSGTYTDDYAGELEDDRVGLQNIENKKSAFYFGGHYLDMDDPYDRAFYNAKKAELEEDEVNRILKDKNKNDLEVEVKKNGDFQKVSKEQESMSSNRLDVPAHINRAATKELKESIYIKRTSEDPTKSRKKSPRGKLKENLKTRKNLSVEKLERINRAKLAKLKQDLVLGDTNDKAKYIDKETLYQDEISDILDAHQEQFADSLDNFEETDNKYKPW